MKIIKDFKNNLWVLAMLLTSFLPACKKEITPVLVGGTQSIGLNFYMASDVLNTYAAGSYTFIYVDKYDSKPIFGAGVNTYPFFYYTTNGLVPEFPLNSGAVLLFARYNSGMHQLIFTDTTNTIVSDTTINFPADSRTELYYTDAQTATNARATYKVLAVQDGQAEVPSDKVGLRFINLSPDAGDLTIDLASANGNKKPFNGSLSFLKATAYQYLDSTDVVSGLLRFTLSNSVNKVQLNTGVPFTPGKSYVVVISGFVNDQQRQVPAGRNADNSLKYTSITITNNLKATLRRSN